jgi:hypothetical protein
MSALTLGFTAVMIVFGILALKLFIDDGKE